MDKGSGAPMESGGKTKARDVPGAVPLALLGGSDEVRMRVSSSGSLLFLRPEVMS